MCVYDDKHVIRPAGMMEEVVTVYIEDYRMGVCMKVHVQQYVSAIFNSLNHIMASM